MTKDSCDRCGKDVTDKMSGTILGIRDGDQEGNGTVTDRVPHLCPACYRAVWRILLRWDRTVRKAAKR